ncbi:hypothetical protein K466DRAFT_605687 [Polyporus arcularius HHB13444]|uniref:Uncharacterized protein n=1 Tax=Polyporus arcularius HHB13444 TaxID=1314778 RepID=A0A5C3NRQ4_9APHY|nr:hypothetical protein K466DRAFT_605687 [Polyporus arcularius HHB13444]
MSQHPSTSQHAGMNVDDDNGPQPPQQLAGGAPSSTMGAPPPSYHQPQASQYAMPPQHHPYYPLPSPAYGQPLPYQGQYTTAFVPQPTTAPQPFAPPSGMPPLMPLPSVTHHQPLEWSCPDYTRLVVIHDDPRCPPCISYLRHSEAAASDPQYNQVHEDARTRQQAAYFEHFQRYRGEGRSDETARLREENRRLREAEEEDSRRFREREQELLRRIDLAWEAHDEQERQVRDLRERCERLQADVDRQPRRERFERVPEHRRSRSPRPRSPLPRHDDQYDRRRASQRPRSPPRVSSSRRPPTPPGPSRMPSLPSRRETHPPRHQPPQVRLPSSRPEFVQGSSRSENTAPSTRPSTNPSTPAFGMGSTNLLQISYDDLSDDNGEEYVVEPDQPVNMKEVQRRLTNQSMRKARRPKRDQTWQDKDRAAFSPIPGRPQPTPPPLANTVPPSTVEGSWPTGLQPVHNTDVKLASSWRGLSWKRPAASLSQMAGALYRVRHLIQQVDAYNGYMGVPGMACLKTNWRGTNSRPRPNVPRRREPRTGIADPRATPSRAASVEVWERYYTDYPWSIPTQLRPDPSNERAVPSRDVIEGNLLIRRVIPSTRSSESSMRASLLDSVIRLFSVHGLFGQLVQRGGYPRGPTENLRPFPTNLGLANVNEFDVARWYARCGVTDRSVLLMSHVARIYRNVNLGRPANSVEPWPYPPTSITAFDHVPTEAELPAMPFPDLVDVTMTDALDAPPAEGTENGDGITTVPAIGAPADSPTVDGVAGNQHVELPSEVQAGDGITSVPGAPSEAMEQE